MKRNKQTGFTLIEIAIVLLIVSILLGYTVALFPIQQELKQYRAVEKEMDDIVNSLIGFAQVNGRLPCADGTGDGRADWPGGVADCTAWFGNFPGKTIGFDGNYSQAGVLLDPWGTAYQYQVSASNSGFPAPDDGVGDFTIANGMRGAGISNLVPNLQVCNTQPAAHTAAAPNDDTVCDANTDAATNLVAVLISVGKDKNFVVAGTSDIQSENLDNSVTDTVFVSSTRNDATGTEYDDIVKWISPNLLFSKMIEAGQLP